MARTVLIVDDVEFVRKTLSELLVQNHYQVVAEATNGLEAVELYARHRPDLVTMDIVMPKLSGIEATRRIIKSDKDAKIVMLSAMGQESLVMEAINAGAMDYLMKPFSRHEVIRTLEHILSGRDKGESGHSLGTF